jgi:hypothetical protein
MALLILEGPWWTPEQKPKRPSVLTHTREERLFLYVAAHGYTRMFGGLGAKKGMQISTLMREVKKAANYSDIEGVVFGSCNIGLNVDDFIQTVKGSHIAWMFGYTCEIDWMTSTFIDVSIFEYMMGQKKGDLRSGEHIIETVAAALNRFNPEFFICSEENDRVMLKDAIRLVIQPRGRGKKPIDATSRLIEKLEWDRNPG